MYELKLNRTDNHDLFLLLKINLFCKYLENQIDVQKEWETLTFESTEKKITRFDLDRNSCKVELFLLRPLLLFSWWSLLQYEDGIYYAAGSGQPSVIL